MSFTVLYLRNTNYIISDSSVELPASRVTGTMAVANPGGGARGPGPPPPLEMLKV